MGVLPRVVTTVPRVRTSSTSASVGGSNPESESESSPESDQHPTTGPLIARNQRFNLPLTDDPVISAKGKSGKRKQRRFMNRECLLHKVDEEDDEVFNVMEVYKSPFQRLHEAMSTVAALASLNALDNLESDFHQERSTMGITKPRHPYMRISRRIRHSIRECVRKRSKAGMVVQVVRQTEEEILSVRSAAECESIVELLWKNYIHRLLLHAVAQYHGLRSTTVLTDADGTEPVVRVVVTPNHPDPNEPSSLLYDMIRFVYTEALADALADQKLCNNTEA